MKAITLMSGKELPRRAIRSTELFLAQTRGGGGGYHGIISTSYGLCG